MVDELRRGFHNRLAEVHADVGRLARVASSAVLEVTVALVEGDIPAGERVAADAQTVSTGHLAVEREVFDLVALQAPVARDLRLLLASLRVAHEVDLSGGLAAAIGRRIPHLDEAAVARRLRVLLADMGGEAGGLLEHAAHGYEVLDADLAGSVIASEGGVRESHRRFLRELFGLRDVPVESAVEMGVIARSYERIADHAVEIAHRVQFVALGSAPDWLG